MFEVIKVLINGDIPESCAKCNFSGDWHDMGDYNCIFTGNSVLDFENTRPDWCPLEKDWMTYALEIEDGKERSE
jgi:hypothetical protein